MHLSKNQILPMIIVFLSVAVAIYFRPLLVIDETRYFGVAWEMYHSGNLLVPHLNGLPYDHKPPLLFWLINLDWHLFGIDQLSARFIPLLFALGSMVLIWQIYKLLWPKDALGIQSIMWIVAGGVAFSFYSTLFMFDIMLGFWVLLAIYGGLKAINEPSIKNFAIITIALTFGILAKSPVVVAHLLPIYLFAHYFAKPNKRFYIGGMVALIAGIALALLWGVPAAIAGGKEYADGIFWGQYAGRAIDSFAHKRPFWWYLPWIPLVLLPWILLTPFWQGTREYFRTRVQDNGIRFLIVWIVGTLFIFSLISGKQLHYIVPEFGAFALLATRFISIAKVKAIRARIIGFIFLFLGIAVILVPFFIKGYLLAYLDRSAFWISGIILALYGLYFILTRFKTKLQLLSLLAWGSLLIIFTLHYTLHLYLATQDLSKFSQAVGKLQDKGITIVHYGKYHNQYHYLGRLKKPLVIIKSHSKFINYINKHPKSAIILYLKRKVPYNKESLIKSAKLRTTNILLLRAKDYKTLLQH